MTTKEEYIKALNEMEEVYYNFDGCMSAMKKFKEDVNLLTGLVNEHFEEKAETNYEHYKDEIIEVSDYLFALVDGKPCQCSGVSYNNCGFSTGHGCGEKVKEWLRKPYEKPTNQLTQFEYDLLQSYANGYKFKDINPFIVMKEKGYFKDVDTSATIHEILDNCEVVG